MSSLVGFTPTLALSIPYVYAQDRQGRGDAHDTADIPRVSLPMTSFWISVVPS